jgi:hypothetical protein
MAFDIRFDQHRDPTQDHLLAEAIREAGNAVLFEYLTRKNIPEKPSIKPPVLISLSKDWFRRYLN